MKKFVGGFVGVAGISTFIVFPAMVQASINSASSNSSSKSLLSQTMPRTTSPSGGTTTPNGSLTALDKEFMTKAAQSDQTEIQTSQLALKRSQNKEVKDFAQRMIKEHTDSSQQLKQIAKKKNFTLPKGVGQENKALLTKLTKLNGTNFDRAYMQGQVQAHTKTLADYQNYLSQGQDSDLSAFANKIAPIVADHLQMAQNMTGESGSSSSGTPGSGTSGTTTPGSGTPGSGTPGSGTPGSGTPGSGTPGSGTPGSGTPGSGTPGSVTPGSVTPGSGTPGSGTSGSGR